MSVQVTRAVVEAAVVLMVITCCCAVSKVGAQESLSLSLERTWGTALGNNIQGTFTLRGSGPDTVANLTVFFNDAEVHFVTGNIVTWTFSTDDYPSGSTNITLVGWDAAGTMYAASRVCVFLSSSVGNLFAVAIVALVAVAVTVKYVPRMLQATRKKDQQ